MKIAFIIPTFYPVIGGAQNNCYFLAKELIKNHEVSVFCSDKTNKVENIDGIDVFRFKETFRYKYYFAFYPSLKRILKRKFDIIHIHGLGFIQQDMVIRKIKKHSSKTKLICTPHGPFMALSYGIIGRVYKKIYTPIIKRVIKKYDRVIQVNPFQYTWMKREYGIPRYKIKLLPNGISENLFKKVTLKEKKRITKKYNLKDKFIISYIGRIQKYKGLDQIIKVLPKLKDVVILIGVGKDVGDTNRLKELARKLNVNKRVLFTGFINEKEKLGLLELSKIFVFPSEWEAFGIGTLEAMAKGNAIISTRTEGGRYLIQEDNGDLFDYGNIKELETKLKSLILNEKRRKRIGVNNIKKAKMFKWSKIAKGLEEIYLEMIR